MLKKVEQTIEPKVTLQNEPTPIYASSFGARMSGTECVLILQRTAGAIIEDHKGNKSEGNAPVVSGLVVMSPQAAKDLMLMLGVYIQNYEANFGLLSSDFQKQIAQANKKVDSVEKN